MTGEVMTGDPVTCRLSLDFLLNINRELFQSLFGSGQFSQSYFLPISGLNSGCLVGKPAVTRYLIRNLTISESREDCYPDQYCRQLVRQKAYQLSLSSLSVIVSWADQ